MIDILGGRVRVDFDPYTLRNEIEATRIIGRLKAHADPYLKDAPGVADILEEFGALLVSTKVTFVFDGTEKQPLLDFKAMLEGYRTMSDAALWEARLVMHPAIIRAWRQAFNESRIRQMTEDLWATPAELPTSRLTPAQKAEAAIPGTPLT